MSAHTVRPEPPLVSIHNLRQVFKLPRSGWNRAARQVIAVEDVSLKIDRHTTIALVGESGCGKSTTGRCILGLIAPTGGSVLFEGEETVRADAQTRQRLRRKMQIIFQNPYSSLNPRHTAGRMLREVVAFHHPASRHEQHERVRSLLTQVGLDATHLDRYPHEFSGGQQQRLGIARALAVEPQFMVCDEPVSSLDVSVQAQIINLLRDLQADRGLAYLFISHDLSVVRHISDRVAVMYQGRIVEQAATADLFHTPHHPYTQALLAAIPQFKTSSDRIRPILAAPALTGCTFRNRCPFAMPKCEITPPAIEVSPNHWSRCWLE